MKKIFLLFTLIIFAFCGGGEKEIPASASGQEAHEHADKEISVEKEDDHEHRELHLSPQKQKEWGIVVGTAASQELSSTIQLPGILTLNQNRTAHISSLVAGKVASLAVDLGNRVNKGQVLLTVNSPDFARAQADFLQTMAKLNLSRKEHERAKMLLEEKAIEEREFLRREAEFEKLSTEVGGLGAVLHAYGMDHEQTEKLIAKCANRESDGKLCELADPNLPLLSPLSGTIIFRDVIVGEHVEPEKILFTVSDLSLLWAVLDAYEKDLPFINKDSRIVIQSSVYPEREWQGKITYISDIIDEKLRTVKIRIEVKNAQGLLKPNMYIQGIVQNKAGTQKLLAIPEEAVQNLNGEKIVFVLEGQDVFSIRHVELGNKIGNQVIIARGLESGQRIVIKGAFTLKTELTKGTFGHGHVH